MTVTTETNVALFVGNGVADEFDYAFRVLDSTHLLVEQLSATTGLVTKTYTAGEYTVSGVGTNAGSVTLLAGALSADYHLRVTRIVPYTQELDVVNQGGFYPETVEDQLDLTVMGLQQVGEIADRALVVPPGETGFVFSRASDRAGKFMAFDAGGNLTETAGMGSDGALRVDLAAITGAALIGKTGGGTVQDYINALTGTGGAALIGKATGGTVADLIKKLETNALGTVATGTTLPLDTATSFTGHVGGATTLYAHRHIVTQQGANNVASLRVQYNGTEITGSGTTTLAEATHNYVWLKDSAILTYGRVVEAHMVSSSSGGVTDFIGFSNASLVHTGSGVIGNCVGFQTGDIGHATLVQNAIGFKAGNFTTASSLTAAFVSEMNTGTNKWGLYITGTADNWIEGKVRWGSTSILANAAGTVSIANVGPTNLAIQEWLHCFGTGGSNRYIPLFG